MEHRHTEETHSVGYGPFVAVWLALLMLTGLTVAVSGVNLKGLSVLTALVIATTKSLLVLFIFMHLLYESRVFKVMMFVTTLTLAVFIGLTFSDILFR